MSVHIENSNYNLQIFYLYSLTTVLIKAMFSWHFLPPGYY